MLNGHVWVIRHTRWGPLSIHQSIPFKEPNPCGCTGLSLSSTPHSIQTRVFLLEFLQCLCCHVQRMLLHLGSLLTPMLVPVPALLPPGHTLAFSSPFQQFIIKHKVRLLLQCRGLNTLHWLWSSSRCQFLHLLNCCHSFPLFGLGSGLHCEGFPKLSPSCPSVVAILQHSNHLRHICPQQY